MWGSCLFSCVHPLVDTYSPRKVRGASRRLASELDSLPDDEATPDSGTSSLDSGKRPLGSRFE